MAYPQLATCQEFDDHVLPSTAFAGIATPIKDAALRWASVMALGFVKKRKVLPLISWSEDLRSAVCDLAAYKLMGRRGFAPSSGSNAEIRSSFDDARDWLLLVSTGKTELVDCVDSTTTPTIDEAGPLAASDPIVNWNYQTRGLNSCRRNDGL